MKNRLAAIIIATSLVLGLGAGVGGAFIYNNAKNVKTTEVTATVENEVPEPCRKRNMPSIPKVLHIQADEWTFEIICVNIFMITIIFSFFYFKRTFKC